MGKDSYRITAKCYDTLFQSVNAGLIAMSMKMFPPVQGMSVLDVGCGTGTQLGKYQRAGCEICGIDPSPAMLKVARKKLGESAELHLGSAAGMQFGNEVFDLVTAMLVLHEMSPENRGLVIAEMKRVLKRNGRILLIDFHPGPIRPLKGWLGKAFITISEIGAGREHYRNYRDFMARKGVPSLVSKYRLIIEQQRIVSGGNMGLFLMRAE